MYLRLFGANKFLNLLEVKYHCKKIIFVKINKYFYNLYQEKLLSTSTEVIGENLKNTKSSAVYSSSIPSMTSSSPSSIFEIRQTVLNPLFFSRTYLKLLHILLPIRPPALLISIVVLLTIDIASDKSSPDDSSRVILLDKNQGFEPEISN